MQTILQAIYAELLPVILQLIAAVLGVVLLRAANVARDRWGIEIEARHREALHSALVTGITAALGQKFRGDEAVGQAAVHVLEVGAPDAVEFFGLSVSELERMALAKLNQRTVSQQELTITAEAAC